MFTVNYDQFKAQRTELYRQADHYRTLKSIRKTHPRVSGAMSALGRMLVTPGQGLIARTEALHYHPLSD
jgi:hypothetical protein